jgi:hypothetical protein
MYHKIFAQSFVAKAPESFGGGQKYMYGDAVLVRESAESGYVIVVLVRDEDRVDAIDVNSDIRQRATKRLGAFSRIYKNFCSACTDKGGITLGARVEGAYFTIRHGDSFN